MAMFVRKKKTLAGVPTSSMGDIAFLLIIFFMLTSKFMKESHVKYEKAASPESQQQEDAKISVIVDEDGAIWLQGQPCASPEQMKEGVEALRGEKKDQVVQLKIHKYTQHKQFSPVIQNLAQAGVKIVFVGDKSVENGK